MLNTTLILSLGFAVYLASDMLSLVRFGALTSLAVVFMLTSLSLAFLSTDRPSSSLMESNSVSAPAPVTDNAASGATSEGKAGALPALPANPTN